MSMLNANQKRECMGIEPDAYSLANMAVLQQGGAESGTLCPIDPDLASVIDAWAFLPEVLKAGILAMVRAASG